MRAEKQAISDEYLDRLKESPYFIVVDYTGLKVEPITELRQRLLGVAAELHIVKNSIFKRAVQESGIADLGGALTGPIAVVTGTKEITGAAKILKNFHAEFEKPVVQFAFMGDERLDVEAFNTLADLPPLEELRAKIVGMLQTPATRIAQVLSAPGGQLARVIKAKADKGE